jgi:hypothetical protein
MTIRQALRGWFRFLWLGLMAVGILAASWHPHTWLNYYVRMTTLALLASSVMGIFACGFRCPRCRSGLLLKAASIIDGRPCVCAKCGVSLDERPRQLTKPDSHP